MLRSFRSAGLAAAMLLASPGASASAAPFDPMRFFTGRTHGEGVIRVIASRPHGIHIDGEGTVDPDGSLTLVQRVDEDGKPVRTREWSLRRTDAGGYAATLSDAVCPVRVAVAGDVVTILFRTGAGLRIDQRLSLRPGGRIVDNRLVVHKHGIRVAVLEETIRRYD